MFDGAAGIADLRIDHSALFTKLGFNTPKTTGRKGRFLRGCFHTRTSSLFGIILAYFRFFSGVNIRMLILPPEKKAKIGSKEPEKRQKPSMKTPS